MKTSLLTTGIVVASLMHAIAYAQVYDLPEPTGELPVREESVLPRFELAEAQYAGLLRLGMLSRNDEGLRYRVLLSPAARLERLDLRVAFGKVRIREAWLVTESGHRIEIQKYRATGILEMASLNSSEKFSLNENIAEILLSAEAFSEDAELLLTAVSENGVPRLSLAPPQKETSSVPALLDESDAEANDCIRNFCVGDVVVFQRQRAKILKIYSNGQVQILQRGVTKMTKTSALKRPLVPPYR